MSRKLNISELLQNSSFLKWLQEGQPTDDEQWQSWQAEDADHRALTKEAADIVRGIPFRKQEMDASQSQAGWDKIEARIKTEKKPSFVYRRQIMPLVAALFLLVVAGLAINGYVQRSQWIVVKTNFGETRTILLPDSSTVILGAHSELTYDKQLAQKATRKVALKGEAFFKVQHHYRNAPFNVQLSDMEVEVLGTSFNISAYKPNAVVSLVEGSLRLSKKTNERTREAVSSTSILLEPDQTAWFDEGAQNFVLAQGKTDYWTSWIDQEWSFGDGIPLSAVLEKIEAIYGLKVVVKDPGVLNEKLAGKVSIESPDILFESLAVLLDLKITRKGQQLIIE
jgi:ferric-dicitrate binding protein FerR (iron transport regulator)